MTQGKFSHIHIRYASAADNHLLAEMAARTFFDSFAADNDPQDMAAYIAASFSPQKQAEELADPLSKFLIAEIDAQVVGYTRLKFGPAPSVIKGQNRVEIARIYAEKEWIGRGVGPQLMQACLDEAIKESCDVIWLDVWELNPRAIAFYRKWGFEIVGRQSFQLGSDIQNDLLMSRAVNLSVGLRHSPAVQSGGTPTQKL
jgi:ribosomal protein S18 acetylase RimI-like enzyme